MGTTVMGEAFVGAEAAAGIEVGLGTAIAGPLAASFRLSAESTGETGGLGAAALPIATGALVFVSPARTGAPAVLTTLQADSASINVNSAAMGAGAGALIGSVAQQAEQAGGEPGAAPRPPRPQDQYQFRPTPTSQVRGVWTMTAPPAQRSGGRH
jgi:hypothetical protein